MNKCRKPVLWLRPKAALCSLRLIQSQRSAADELTHNKALAILIPMSKRLQVLLEESELREIRRAARGDRLTVAEWVRQALRQARKEKTAADPAKKLAAVRNAANHQFPTGDIRQMVAEIESGYGN